MTTSDLTGAPRPDLLTEAKRIMTEQNVGMNRAVQLATDIVRAWAVANGYAK